MSGETRLREQICTIGRSIFDRGLTSGSTGNISARLDDGSWLMTPTNASPGRLDPARISRLDANGRLLSGDPPSKEIPLHSAMYDERASAGAIVHLHSTHSVAVLKATGWPARQARIPSAIARWVLPVPGE